MATLSLTEAQQRRKFRRRLDGFLNEPSRSRQELWHKGATSGHVQKVVEILTDCDQDALVIRVHQLGAGACHTGRSSCFYRKVIAPTSVRELAAATARPLGAIGGARVMTRTAHHI